MFNDPSFELQPESKWDSIHYVQCILKAATKTETNRVEYRVNTSVLLKMDAGDEKLGDVGQINISARANYESRETHVLPPELTD